LDTPYYEPQTKTRKYTRFTVLFFWNDDKIDIWVNAKVSDMADCDDDRCEKCDKKLGCVKCSGKLLPEEKGCVDKCSEGFYKNGDKCSQCSDEDCAVCKSAKTCIKCKDEKVLKNGDCLVECGKGYIEEKGGICKAEKEKKKDDVKDE